MSIFVVLLFGLICPGDSSLPTKATQETSRVKRDLWMQNDYYADDYYRAEGSKYSWACRDCNMAPIVKRDGDPGPTLLCQLEAKWNNESYPFQPCTTQQFCEKASKTDPDESFYDTWKDKLEEEGYTPINTVMGDTIGIQSLISYTACCKKFGFCDIKFGESGSKLCEMVSTLDQNKDGWDESTHRVCCRRGGFLCDFPVREPTEERIQQCNKVDGCESYNGLSWSCCLESNVTCTIPECGENDGCLTGFHGSGCLYLEQFDQCCEFYNKCDGPVCEQMTFPIPE